MHEFKADSSFKRVLKNGGFTAVQFLAYTLYGIVLTPFLLRMYGAESYGLIALAGFLTMYVGMIAGCVGGSVARFLNISLNRNDWDEACEIFSTAIVGNIVIVLLQIPVFALGVWQLEWLIDFPADQSFDFRVLVSCNILVFLISVLTGVLGTPIYASNRLDFEVRIGLVQQFLRLLLLFSLISWLGDKLWIIGLVDVVISVIGVLYTFRIYRRIAEGLVFRVSFINLKWIKPILSLSGLTLIAALSHILIFRMDIWILNRFVSAGMAGIYAALRVWPNFLTQVVMRVTNLIAPTYYIDYARNERERVLRNTLITAKLIAFIVIMATACFVLFGDMLLPKWLGRPLEPVEMFLLSLFFINGALTLSSEAVDRIFQVFNKPLLLAIVSFSCGMLNVGLSLLLIRMGMGVYGVVTGSIISSFLLKSVFQTWYASYLLKNNPWQMWYITFVSLAMCLLVMGVKHLLVKNDAHHWYISICYLVLCMVVSLFILTKKEERLLILNMVRKRISSR